MTAVTLKSYECLSIQNPELTEENSAEFLGKQFCRSSTIASPWQRLPLLISKMKSRALQSLDKNVFSSSVENPPHPISRISILYIGDQEDNHLHIWCLQLVAKNVSWKNLVETGPKIS